MNRPPMLWNHPLIRQLMLDLGIPDNTRAFTLKVRHNEPVILEVEYFVPKPEVDDE